MKKIPFPQKRLTTRICSLLVALAMLVVLSACGKPSEPQGNTEPGANDVLKVGNVYISQEQMDEYTKLMLNVYMLSQGMDYESFVTDEVIEESKAGVLDMMAQTEALRAHFASQKPIPESLDTEIADFKSQLFSSYPEVEERFKTMGITDNAIKYYLESNYLHEASQNEATDNGALPSEAEVEAFYAENSGEFFTDEQRRSSQVLFEDRDHKPETKALAEDIRKKIISGEVVFEDMAAQYNTDSTKDTGGDLDFVGRGQFVEPFENALFALEKIGDMSEVVESDYGYHIIKLTDIKDAGVQPLDEVSGTIKQYLGYNMEADNAKKITSEAGVEYLSDKYPAPDKRPTTQTGTDGSELALPEDIIVE